MASCATGGQCMWSTDLDLLVNLEASWSVLLPPVLSVVSTSHLSVLEIDWSLTKRLLNTAQDSIIYSPVIWPGKIHFWMGKHAWCACSGAHMFTGQALDWQKLYIA